MQLISIYYTREYQFYLHVCESKISMRGDEGM